MQVGKFSIVDGVVLAGEKRIISVGENRGFIITVIFVGIDRVVGAPLDNKTTRLEERLFVEDAQSLDAGNGGVGDGQLDPSVAGDARTRGEAQEIIVPLKVAGRSKGDSTEGAGTDSVCRGKIIEQLHV